MTHELSITRLIDAPVAIVWQAWTEQFAEWFCPRPWRVEVIEQDLRTGGASSMVMHGPAGEQMPMQGVYLEVVPHARIVSTDALVEGWVPQEAFMVRLDEFAEEAGGTRYTATARHWTAEAKANHEARGFTAGWNASADQLEDEVRRLVAEP